MNYKTTKLQIKKSLARSYLLKNWSNGPISKVDLIGIDRANSGFRSEGRWNRILADGHHVTRSVSSRGVTMRLCINAYAYMHQRRRVSGRQVRGGTDFPASKIAKTKNVPREANKLWGEKFSWIRERERGGEGGEERREDGIKRNMEYEDGAAPTSSPCLFRTPFR